MRYLQFFCFATIIPAGSCRLRSVEPEWLLSVDHEHRLDSGSLGTSKYRFYSPLFNLYTAKSSTSHLRLVRRPKIRVAFAVVIESLHHLPSLGTAEIIATRKRMQTPPRPNILNQVRAFCPLANLVRAVQDQDLGSGASAVVSGITDCVSMLVAKHQNVALCRLHLEPGLLHNHVVFE